MISDLELVTRVTGSNDQAAYCRLVERHQAPIRRFLRRLLAGDHGSADDLAQETFLLAFRKIHTWRGSGSFPTWLHSIAYRQFLQFSRKHSRQQVMAEVPQSTVDFGPAIEAEMLTEKLMSLVSAEERACLTLAYAAGMSHAEVCNITRLPLGTVKSHIKRGKQKLQRWLEDNDHSIQKTGAKPAREARHAHS